MTEQSAAVARIAIIADLFDRRLKAVGVNVARLELAQMVESAEAELAQLRAANVELQAEIKELHERLAAYNSEITNCLKNIAELVTQRRGLEVELSDARAAMAQTERELTKWRNWHPDDETLAVLKEQASGSSKAGYVTYIAALEQRCRDNVAALAQYEGDGKRWHSFETVQALVKERDAATRRAEQAEAVVSKLAEAVIWMSGSDDFSDNGKAHAGWVTIRDGALAAALAGPEGGPPHPRYRSSAILRE